MGSDESVIQQTPDAQLPSVSGQILISVHGSAGSGKTTLINQFMQKPFNSEYLPTKQMESRQVLWKSIQQPNKTFRIVIWDVVESTTTSPRPVDTISRADGIVVIYNPNDIHSVEYALSILYKLPIGNSDNKSKIPVLILSNFLDLRGNHQKIHPRLKNAPYPQIQTSIKTGIGLDICAIWIDRALLYNKRRSLDAQLRSVREEREELTNAIRCANEKNEKNPSKNQKMISVRKSQPIYRKSPLPNGNCNHNRIRMPSLSQLLTVKTDDENCKEKDNSENDFNTIDSNDNDINQSNADNKNNNDNNNDNENDNNNNNNNNNENNNNSDNENNNNNDNENNNNNDNENNNNNDNENNNNNDNENNNNNDNENDDDRGNYDNDNNNTNYIENTNNEDDKCNNDDNNEIENYSDIEGKNEVDNDNYPTK